MPKLVIMVSGRKRAGKDFTSNLISTQLENMSLSNESMSFAAPMKRIIATTFGITTDQLEQYKNNPDEWVIETSYVGADFVPTNTSNYRLILQNFGSEAMKPEFGDDVWAELMANRIRNSDSDIVIIPDYRFDSEYNHLFSLFDVTTLYIKSSNTSTDTHASEALPSTSPDFIIDNSEKDGSIHDSVSTYMDFLKVRV